MYSWPSREDYSARDTPETIGFKSWEQLRNEAAGYRQILVKLGLGPIDNKPS